MKILSKYSDEAIVLALSQPGDSAEKCLKAIYRDNLKFAISYVKQNSGSVAEAEDVFQDSVIALYEQILNKSFRGESGVNTYLMKILRNKWVNVLNRKQVHLKVLEKKVDYDGYNEERELTIKQMARKLLSEVGKDCQKLLSLVFFYKYSMEEAAEFIGFKNAQNARNKKLKCLKKMRQAVKDEPVFAKTLETYVGH